MNDSFPALVLLRGLPGAGKTTLAKLLCENGRHPVFSVDDFFTNPQTAEYRFEFDKNHLAYKQCEDNVRTKMKQGCPKVFVDNTFTMEWELEPYVKMAAEYGYRLFVITVENRHKGKNMHGISEEQLKKMATKYRVQLY